MVRAGGSSDDGISADAMAIMFSVLIGGVGYLVQVREMSERTTTQLQKRTLIIRTVRILHRTLILTVRSVASFVRVRRRIQLVGPCAQRRFRHKNCTPTRSAGSGSMSRSVAAVISVTECVCLQHVMSRRHKRTKVLEEKWEELIQAGLLGT